MPSTCMLLLTVLLPALALSGHVDSGIVGGRTAKPHSRPYIVSLRENNKHVCGGFLVSQYFVMTAAHCFQWGKQIVVVVGAHYISKAEASKMIGVRYYHIYPGFSNTTLANDIMLLQLERAVFPTKEVKWIDLPKRDNDVKDKTVCSVAGWGATETHGRASPQLQEVNVTIVGRKSCEKEWKKTLTAGMMCAGGSADNKGFCQGDSGGPLVCKKTAVGIVSFNEKGNCNKPQCPNVYTQVSKYLPWVNCIMKSIK